MHEGRNAPFGRAGTWFLAALIGSLGAAALGGCTALVQFDDPPGDEDGGDDAGSPDATARDGSSSLLDATADAADARDASDAGTHPADAAADGSVADASDGSMDLLASCPSACATYPATEDFWVCGWKRAACIADPADLNIVYCAGTTAEEAYTCPVGETCLGSGNEDFCDPCNGSTGPMCDPSVKDSAHPAYLVNCMGELAPTYQTCSDSQCVDCSSTVKTTTPP